MRLVQTNEVIGTLSRQSLARAPAENLDGPSELGGSFSDALVRAFEGAAEAEHTADEHVRKFALGEAGIHETVLAQERAGLMLRYAVTMKNRAVDAYRELMNTQV